MKDFLKYSLYLVFLLGLPVAAIITQCSGREEKRREREINMAYRDSVIRVRQAEKEYRDSLIHTQRSQFYNEFNQDNHLFYSYLDFENWLSQTNMAGIELLYRMYSSINHSFSGFNDAEEVAEYLAWEPLEYEVYCEECGSTLYVYPGDEYEPLYSIELNADTILDE